LNSLDEKTTEVAEITGNNSLWAGWDEKTTEVTEITENNSL